MQAYANSKTDPAHKDKRSTPRWVYNAIVETIGITPTWDVAAEKHTSVTGPGRYWSQEDDSLSIDWVSALTMERQEDPGIGIVAWMNPPYSCPGKWCAKAASEAAKGLIVIGLLPDDRSTGWYQEYIHGIAPTVFLTPDRIPFIDPATGLEQAGNPKGSIIPIWLPWRTGQTQEAYIPADIWAKHKPKRGK